jgi:hypothetical protein
MTTYRIAKRARFATIDQQTVNDERLSFRARGILLWLLDKPDDWRASSDVIERAGTEGRDAVRTALKELEALGYLKRDRFQDPETGFWNTVTTVFERPTEDGFPGVGDPAVGFPGASSKTETHDYLPTPLVPSVGSITRSTADEEFAVFWENYPRKVSKPAALKAYKAAMKKTDPAVILDGLAWWKRYWSERGEPQFTPHPSTWLNQERWNDEPPPMDGSLPKMSKGMQAMQAVLRREGRLA